MMNNLLYHYSINRIIKELIFRLFENRLFVNYNIPTTTLGIGINKCIIRINYNNNDE